ncbi:hypothetical protein PGT21_030909 [Puccinia graminis f. sp. tritici]|uniref:Uncharacterized protein n=1 Tax=Puccinia graminis f. sp. tritici TaxID=56615 RepID=A0A5B0MYY1_PUCGR|nr:hypothetical protein PGT21_030909 [Puccinia graminis f. sp. tritici]KAA1131340.1 hypothetical protein PGTUg99_032126 [Puccinia graminis f. sp. tritici]
MNTLISTVILLASIIGLAHGIYIDKQCQQRYSQKKQTHGVCGRIVKRVDPVDPQSDAAVWHLHPQSTCKPFAQDHTAIPLCCDYYAVAISNEKAFEDVADEVLQSSCTQLPHQ